MCDTPGVVALAVLLMKLDSISTPEVSSSMCDRDGATRGTVTTGDAAGAVVPRRRS